MAYANLAWKKPDHYQFMMGASHGHFDKLHMDLVIQGEDVLTDAGCCTYVVDEGRFEFKDPPAHGYCG